MPKIHTVFWAGRFKEHSSFCFLTFSKRSYYKLLCAISQALLHLVATETSWGIGAILIPILKMRKQT